MVQDRRKSDTDLTCIKISLAKIESKIDSHIEQQIKNLNNCDKEREILFGKSGRINERIGSLETQQKLVSWIGGTVAITWFGVISKWIAQHLKQ